MAPRVNKNHCSNKKQICWTGCYLVTWGMLVIGLLTYHASIGKLVPELADLPQNLADGFYKVFKFNALESDSKLIQSECVKGLQKCGVTASQCSNLPNGTSKASTGPEKAKILNAFDTSLGVVSRICNDKYFGTPDLAKISGDLNKMITDVKKIKVLNEYCQGTNVLYCSIHSSATVIVSSVSTVTAGIDVFVKSDMVKQYEDNAGKLTGLHLLPYVLVISALFFFAFWWRDGTCCCCKGGSKIGCCYLFWHGFFWLLFIIVNSIFLIAGLAFKHGQDKIQMDFLKGKPTLEQFLEHVKTVYPEFWELVFAGMEAGLLQFFNSTIVFEVFSIVIVAYGCCMCCCRPYKEQEGKVVAM